MKKSKWNPCVILRRAKNFKTIFWKVDDHGSQIISQKMRLLHMIHKKWYFKQKCQAGEKNAHFYALEATLAWSEATGKLGYCQEEEERPNNAEDLTAAIKASWASVTPEQSRRPIASTPRYTEAVAHAKEAQPSTKETFQKLDISA